MAEPRFYASPVDYEAWRKGYTPPSEHALIDALAHRGAKVISAAAMGETSWWLVIQGKRPSRKQLQLIQRLLLDMVDDAPEELPSSEVLPSIPSAEGASTSLAPRDTDSSLQPSSTKGDGDV